MTSPRPYRCWVEIDLAALERNLQLLRDALPRYLRLIAVVKADAYGHGLAPTAARLMRAGADLFAVANVEEAARVREIGGSWPVLVLGALLPDEEAFAAELGVAMTVSSHGEVIRFQALAARIGRVLPVHLKIDTGMGRLGVWHEEAGPLFATIRDASGLRLEGIYTHFSCAATDPAFTHEQRQRFARALSQMPGLDAATVLTHADNSAGLESFPRDGSLNGVRVGLLQFGVRPGAGTFLAELPVEPVFSWHSRLSLVKELPVGATISYGALCRLERPTRVGVVAAGYGDGIPTRATGKVEVLLRGRRCSVLGRVTMDQLVVDLTSVPQAAPGDLVTIIGEHDGARIRVEEFATWSGQVPWEVLCGVTKRVPRLYRSDTAT